MEIVLEKHERCGSLLLQSRVSVERGKVVSATPSFEWAVGGGLHAVLSWAATRKIRWKKRRSRGQPGQMELGL